jgi:hypothetical protein
VPPFSESSLATFEADCCEDRYWGRPEAINGNDARIMTSGRVLAIVGRHADPFFSNAETGILGQFRQQYFLLFLIAHFHRSALLSMSDQLAIAMNGLEIGNIESVKRFKRVIRQAMEIFLRFTHRFWYHQISNQDIVRSLFQRTRNHLGTDLLYEEVRQEMIDMNGYLDSDSLRRQANTILRLTVVTIMGLIATIGTGYLGMNLIAAADQSIAWRTGLFLLVIVATTLVILATVAQSRRLSDFIDVLSNDRVGWGEKWSTFRQPRKSRPTAATVRRRDPSGDRRATRGTAGDI